MKKTTKLLFQVVLCCQLAGCSMVQDYIINAAPNLFKPNTSALIIPVLKYDFIEPRRTELNQATLSKLDKASHRDVSFTYFSATGHRCYTLSLTPLQSACDIDGQWIGLAPILSY